MLVILISFFLGLGIWYFRQTSTVVQVVVDAKPLIQESGITNLVILGVGGEGHEGGDLTDTILIVSLRHKDNSVKLLSVPRDIWVDSFKIKINAAYHYGNEKGAGEGIKLARTALTEVLGIPIHYSAVINFSGFIKLIDTIGGLI